MQVAVLQSVLANMLAMMHIRIVRSYAVYSYEPRIVVEHRARSSVLFYQRLLLSILLSIGFKLCIFTYIRDNLEQHLSNYCLRTKLIVTYVG